MKIIKKTIQILGIAVSLFTGIASAQTNVYPSFLIKTNSKTFVQCNVHDPKYWYVSQIRWKPVGSGFTNCCYAPGTNVMSISTTNPNVLLQAVSTVGGVMACGTGTLTWTDPFTTNVLDRYQFTGFVTSSIPWWPDTNDPVGLTTVGFTNQP